MDFDLENELSKLIKQRKVEKAIEVAESKLSALPKTEFHRILNRNLLDQADLLLEFAELFYHSAEDFYHSHQGGFFRSLFSKQKPASRQLEAVYAEMNAFTINPDRWFVDLFAFSQIGSREDFDWLADFEYATENSFSIKGFEDIQQVYADYMSNKKFEIERELKASNVCELIVVLRLQELFQYALEKATTQGKPWSKLPIFVTAHDYEMILELPK